MKRMRKCPIVIRILALFTLAGLAACETSSAPPQKFTLRIGLLRTIDDLPYFIMREQEFDKRNGLQFTEISVQGGAELVEEMVEGSVDVGANVGPGPILAAAERGLIPSKIIPVAAATLTDPDHPGGGVLVAPSVQSWKDLAGKHIGVNAISSTIAAAIRGRLELEGVRKYTLVELPFANMGLAVSGGNVAAASMMEPWLTQSLLRGDGKLLGWVFGGEPFERMVVDLIVFNAGLRRENPQEVKAFLRAHLQAVRWINDNPQQVPIALTKWLGVSGEVSRKVKLWRWVADGRIDPPLLENMQPTLVKQGLLKAPIPARQLWDEALLNEVLAEKR